MIPNVKKGTIIEFKYIINSQYRFELRDWEFQWKIPVVYSEYEVKMIPFYEYTWLLQGADKFDSQISYINKGITRHFALIDFEEIVHKFIMKDIPAFDNEEYITSINDYIIKLDFQLSKINYPSGVKVNILTTWEDMIKELLKHADFGKYIKKSKSLALKLIGTEYDALKTDKEKFDFALKYVKYNFNWNGDNDKYATKSAAKFIKEKHGNCSDINLFTIGLLNSMGIKAEPVLISTRDNGKIKYDYPYTHFFNYVIILANIDGSMVLTDATEILSLNNRVPTRCINDKGLVIQEDKIEWVDLECMFPSEIKTNFQHEIINNNIINSSITQTATEYDALYYRNNYTDKIETVKKRIENKDYSINDTSITIQNQLNIEKPYYLTFKLASKPEILNEKLYLAPFLNESISNNPLKQKERTYPIDMTYPKKRIFNSTILIPDGYKVHYLPSEQQINNHLFDLTYSINSDESQIIVSFEYFFKKSIYPSSDYSIIKFFLNEIIKKGNEKVVLSKKLEESN